MVKSASTFCRSASFKGFLFSDKPAQYFKDYPLRTSLLCLICPQKKWSPIYDIAAILTSIQSLLCDPNPDSPANTEAARLFEQVRPNFREYLDTDTRVLPGWFPILICLP